MSWGEGGSCYLKCCLQQPPRPPQPGSPPPPASLWPRVPHPGQPHPEHPLPQHPPAQIIHISQHPPTLTPFATILPHSEHPPKPLLPGPGHHGTLPHLNSKLSLQGTAGSRCQAQPLSGGTGCGGRPGVSGCSSPPRSLSVSCSLSTTTSTQHVTAQARAGEWLCHTRLDSALACLTLSGALRAVRFPPGMGRGQVWGVGMTGVGNEGEGREKVGRQTQPLAAPVQAATGGMEWDQWDGNPPGLGWQRNYKH